MYKIIIYYWVPFINIYLNSNSTIYRYVDLQCICHLVLEILFRKRITFQSFVPSGLWCSDHYWTSGTWEGIHNIKYLLTLLSPQTRWIGSKSVGAPQSEPHKANERTTNHQYRRNIRKAYPNANPSYHLTDINVHNPPYFDKLVIILTIAQ